MDALSAVLPGHTNSEMVLLESDLNPSQLHRSTRVLLEAEVQKRGEKVESTQPVAASVNINSQKRRFEKRH